MTNQIPHNSEADENDVLGDTKLVSTRATYPYSVHICRVVRIIATPYAAPFFLHVARTKRYILACFVIIS